MFVLEKRDEKPSSRNLAEASPVACAETIPYESVYETGIPSTIEMQMESLYQNIFSTFARIRAYENNNGICAFTFSENQRILSILAYRLTKNKIAVLNEQIPLNAREINEFAKCMFSRFNDVATIYFKAIKTDVQKLKYPYHAINFTNDIVLSLPDSEEEYLARLGKSTRENIRRYLKILKRDFPNFSCDASERDAGSREYFEKIVDFNRTRMALKDKVSGISNLEAERLWKLVTTHGFIVSITIDGQVRAGTICYRVGSNYFMRVVAHDSAFNEYGLGFLASYMTICECIERGGKEFHFLWGNEEYKFRLLGKARDFDSITIYRSKSIFLLNLPTIFVSILKNLLRDAKIWALDPANKKKIIPKCAIGLRGCVRALR